MNFLHYSLQLGPGEAVRVTLDKQANVRLLDDVNFRRYKEGGQHTYRGGLAKASPVVLHPPIPGHWNVVIDLGGRGGSVRAAVAKISG